MSYKVFAVGLKQFNNKYMPALGTFAVIKLDGRLSKYNMAGVARLWLNKRGYKSFILVRVPSLMVEYSRYTFYKELEHNLPIYE